MEPGVAASLFGVFNGTRLGFNPAGGTFSTIITARFNVTNTWGGGASDTPPWTTLEMGALNTSVFDPLSAPHRRAHCDLHGDEYSR